MRPGLLQYKNSIKLKSLKGKNQFSRLRLVIFGVVFACIGGYILYTSFAASLPSVYVAQNASGTADGSSCSNAKAVSFFNTAGNWGAGSTQIGPATTVHLCGTITTALTAQGSGVSGSPITIFFEPGSKLSEPVCPGRGTGCLDLDNKSYITVDGGSNGIIENTDSGTNLTNHGGSYGINALSCDNCEVKNLTIQNIYVHTGTGSEIDQTQVRAIDFSGNNFLFHNNVVHDAGWAVTFGGDNMQNDRLYGNDIYNVDHGIVPTYSGTGTSGPLYIYNNHFHDFANWDTADNAYHHDGIHCFSATGSPGETINGFYIYNNTFDGDIGGHATAWIFLEGGSGASATPCSNTASTIYIFNNYMTSSTHNWSANDAINVSFGNELVANNTVIGPDATNNGAGGCFSWTSGSTVYNNAAGGCNQVINGSSTATVDYNAYASCTGSFNCFAIGPSSNWTANFSLYQSHYPALDAHSVADLSAAVGTNAAGAGKNLTSMCTGDLTPLCSDINGTPRPASGAWDAGAVQSVPSPNVWISTAGNDTTCVRGDQTKPCLSLNKAFAIAQCGDIVQVAAGTYASQTISSVKACTSSTQVKFVPAAGAQPIFNNVTIQTGYVWIEGMKVPHSLTGTTVGSWTVEPTEPGNLPSVVSYVTLKNDEGGALYIFAEHVDVLGGSYGGFSACLTGVEDLTRIWQENISSSTQDYRASSYITFDGVTVHDGTDNGNKCGDAANGPHVDAMQILGGHNITIRDSFFYNCPTSCIIGSGFRTGEDNYLIENNFFQEVEHPGAVLNFGYVSAGDPPTGANMVIRYNTTNGTIAAGCVSGSTGCWDVYGNVMGHTSYCGGFMSTWEYNVVADGSCSAGGGKAGTPVFIGPTPQSSYGSSTVPNFHLAANDTVAFGAGDPGRYPSTDYDGNLRPQDGAPEAGADEIGSGSLQGDLNSDSHVNITDLSILLSHYGQAVSAALGDINNDGTCNITDLSILLSHYGT